MAYINEHYLKLQGSYLFANIARKVEAHKEAHPEADIVRLGIGDVTQPLVPAVIDAMHRAVDDLAHAETFHGYGPENGYDFLIDEIIHHDYERRGIHLDRDEVFISDGAKSDVANIQEIFRTDCQIAISDPVYPVYLDTNVMAGRTGEFQDGQFAGVEYLPCTPDGNFNPTFPTKDVDLIYLCSPNNPTGTALTREQLQAWVDFARQHDAIILYDSTYEAYITEENIPHSIYEIEGAKEVAIELRSFSKTAGFTGVRCAYTVVPKEAMGRTQSGERQALNPLWNRRQSTKFNGASYITQRGAAAIFTPEGQAQIKEQIRYYQENARLLREAFAKAGLTVYGGVNAPYVWVQTPGNMTSWEFFDLLLERCHIVGTPGAGFGPHGEGYFRVTAFGSREGVHKAMERLETLTF